MTTAAGIAIAIVGLLHLYFLVLEMFLWTRPAGLRAFSMTREQAEQSKTLASNQGLYNGFLAAGLFWSISLNERGRDVAIFFLACVIVAGVYGAATASRKILWFQALPGAIAMALLFL